MMAQGGKEGATLNNYCTDVRISVPRAYAIVEYLDPGLRALDGRERLAAELQVYPPPRQVVHHDDVVAVSERRPHKWQQHEEQKGRTKRGPQGG